MTTLANLGAMLAHAIDGRTLATAARRVADDLIMKAPGSPTLQAYVAGAGVGHAAACNAVRAIANDLRAAAAGSEMLAPKLVMKRLAKADQAQRLIGTGEQGDHAAQVEHWQRAAAAAATGDTAARPYVPSES